MQMIAEVFFFCHISQPLLKPHRPMTVCRVKAFNFYHRHTWFYFYFYSMIKAQLNCLLCFNSFCNWSPHQHVRLKVASLLGHSWLQKTGYSVTTGSWFPEFVKTWDNSLDFDINLRKTSQIILLLTVSIQCFCTIKVSVLPK